MDVSPGQRCKCDRFLRVRIDAERSAGADVRRRERRAQSRHDGLRAPPPGASTSAMARGATQRPMAAEIVRKDLRVADHTAWSERYLRAASRATVTTREKTALPGGIPAA